MRSSESSPFPSRSRRLYGVWYRHVRVYTRHIFSNGLPPFLEPMIFLAGIGLGLGRFITDTMEGLEFLTYIGTGLLMTSAMFTAAFECSFGTFIRLEFEKVYDGMLTSPMTVNDLIVGEIIWAGTKGFFFTAAVLFVLAAFGVVPLPMSLFAPLLGFATAVMFACLSLYITSFVKTINHFSFYFTGFISPMFFFSGVFFPIASLPALLQPVAELLPLTHSVRLTRALAVGSYDHALWWSAAYIVVFTSLFGFLAIRRLRRRLIS